MTDIFLHAHGWPLIRFWSGQLRLLLLAWVWSCPALSSSTVWAQTAAAGSSSTGTSQVQVLGETADRLTVNEEELQQLAAEAAANRDQNRSASTQSPRELNFLQLLLDGGPLMIPLALVSVLVLSISLERLINLRMSCVLPRKLRRDLVTACKPDTAVQPQELYQLGSRYPSATSRVLHSLLRKVGRPVPELESALQDACQREADRMYATVRWLAAAAAIAPLLGLLGTVWGMILAFFETTQPGLGLNRTQQLAQGISIAFVNTLGGLGIAIPAAAFAHFFEGRIIKMMAVVQELLQGLIPRLESFEGVTRFDVDTTGLVPRRNPESLAAAGTAAVSGPSDMGDDQAAQPLMPHSWESSRVAAIGPTTVPHPTTRGR